MIIDDLGIYWFQNDSEVDWGVRRKFEAHHGIVNQCHPTRTQLEERRLVLLGDTMAN